MIKKLIVNVFIVGMVVFVLDFSIGRSIRHFYFTQESGENFRTTYAMEKVNAEIVIFGSSRASHHYDPQNFEDSLTMSFFNSGRDGYGIFFQTAILRSILKRYTPKIIILDFDDDLENKKIEYDRLSSLLPYYRTHPEIRSIVELKSPYEKTKLLSEIYPFNSEILTTAMGNLDYNKKRKIDFKGYLPIDAEWHTKLNSVNTFIPYQPDTNKVNVLKEFIHTAKAAGVRLYVIFSPVFEKTYRNQGAEICRTICNSEKVHFWDYSQDTSFLNSPWLFGNATHLNHNGVKRFNQLIVTEIKKDINKPFLAAVRPF